MAKNKKGRPKQSKPLPALAVEKNEGVRVIDKRADRNTPIPMTATGMQILEEQAKGNKGFLDRLKELAEARSMDSAIPENFQEFVDIMYGDIIKQKAGPVKVENAKQLSDWLKDVLAPGPLIARVAADEIAISYPEKVTIQTEPPLDLPEGDVFRIKVDGEIPDELISDVTDALNEEKRTEAERPGRDLAALLGMEWEDAADDYLANKPTYDQMVAKMCDAVLVNTEAGSYEGDYLYLLRKGTLNGFLVVGYGSCSGCDALEGCDSWNDLASLFADLERDIRWSPDPETLFTLICADMRSHWYDDAAYADFADECGRVLLGPAAPPFPRKVE